METNNITKVLYINAGFSNNSGADIIAVNTFDMFNKGNYESALFSRKGTYDDNYKYTKYFLEDKKPVTIKEKLYYFYNLEAQKNIEFVLDDFKPDIIHIHSIFAQYLTYSVLAPCINRKIPIIMTMHDAYLVCPTTKLMKNDAEFCSKKLCKGYNKFNCLFNNCRKNHLKSFYSSLSAFINKLTGYDKQIAKFITPSDALRNLMIENNNDITPDKIITINNFLSNEEFGNTKPNYTNKGYFLYIGRLSHEKGVQYLLEAIKDLPRDIEFHIVGKGPEEDKLKEYAEENHLDNVKFLGHKSREEIKEEYQNCISTILPCNWFENFPTTNMESFINGKPVIASNIGGIPEQVEHNKTGLLFEPANVEQLKECILKYWNNPDLVIQHGKNGYEKAKIQYSEERYYNELVNLYNEVLEKRKND